MYSTKEFIAKCLLCGYSSKKTAKEYVKGKEKLTDDDFIEVFRINERKNDLTHREAFIRCNMDGEDLLNALNKRPLPWDRDYDLNRGVRYLRENNILD